MDYEDHEEGGDDKDSETRLEEALELYDRAVECERDNREAAKEDIEFGLLSDQWDETARKNRDREGKPCLTINKVAPNIRQVVNDSRQNRPTIRVRPADSAADKETAEVINGLIRNIDVVSGSDIAYDTAVLQAVSGGFGYIRVGLQYVDNESFEQDIVVERVFDQFSVYGDPDSTSADGSDWNCAFVIERMPEKEFDAKYPKADKNGWDTDKRHEYMDDDGVWIAEYWKRSEEIKPLYKLSDGDTVTEEVYNENIEMYQALGVQIVDERQVQTHSVCQYIMTRGEILEKNEWAGKYIPIIPVYGEEIIYEGKRILKSMIRDAKDAQRNFNFWRSTGTEIISLVSKAPYIGEEGAFDADPVKWASANVKNYSYIEHKKGTLPPQRQPFAGVPAGVLQEAMNAAEDIDATLGMFGASRGEQDNAISGRAIMARQKESDTGMFHFIDNLSRSLRQMGRVIVDLIPHVYQAGRIVRIIGEDGKKVSNVQVGVPGQMPQGQMPQGQMPDYSNVYDFNTGKYDVTVEIGPGYTSKRVEAAQQMIEFSRVVPEAAGKIGDLIAKNLDWPGADEIEERLNPTGNPQIAALQQQMQQMQQMLQQQGQALAAAQQDKQIDAAKLQIDGYNAETNRLKLTQAAMTPEQVQALVMQTLQQILNSPDVLQAQQPMQQPMQQPPQPQGIM